MHEPVPQEQASSLGRGTKPFLLTLQGEEQARPPVWLMRQAGRYLPEYRQLRAKAKTFIDFCLTPELAIEVTLQPVRRFQMDAAILFADILLVPYALGQDLSFVEGEGPRLKAIEDAAALNQLSGIRLAEALSPVMQTVRGVRAALPEDVALIGFAGAPWTVATYMIEGQGGTDFERSRSMAWSEPVLFGALIDRLVHATSAYLIAQADAGAEALQLFDSWAGSVPAGLFDTAVIQPTARIVVAVKARHPHIPIIGFPRGAGMHLSRYVAETGVDAVGIDHMTDMAAAAALVPRTKALQGNLDPVLLRAGGKTMQLQAQRLLHRMQGRPFVFNLGHGVLQQTPPHHVTELLALIRRDSPKPIPAASKT